MTPTFAAFVPMRHHSERVPGKNYRLLAGKPLYHHIISTLQAVPQISKILVDTDSPVIMEGLAEHFPDVMAISRPKHLRGEMVPMNEILMYDTGIIEADYYLQTHSTNPLLRSETVSNAIKVFLENNQQYDSLFGVTRLQTRLYDQHGKPINHDPNVLLRTQDLPPVYEENSCIYIFDRETLLSRQNRLGQSPLMYVIPAEEAWDIDEELDFQIAEVLYQRRLREEGE